MSAPISSFSKLSITQMQSSRTHPKGKGTAFPSDDESSSSDEHSEEDLEEESDSDDEEDDGKVDEAANAVYTHRVYAIDHCRHTGTHYAFQMASARVERYSIRIGTALPAEPSCSCRESGTCRHISWLLQQLSGTRSEENTSILLTPYEQISTRGLDRVCEDLHWELREEADSVPEETRWELNKDYSSVTSGRQTRGRIRQRMHAVRDIMATMSPTAIDDYRRDIFDASDNLTKETIFTKGDLEATVSKILIFDDKIFNRFQYLVSRDVRAADYFTKMGLKAKDACDRLDTFCEIGQAAGRQYDLIWCAQKLVDIVAAISANVAERQPLSPSSREAAAKVLVMILGMVVRDRNHDAYQNPNVPRRRPHGEPQRDRNLYLRLIGDPRSSPSSGNFVINALQDLPEAVRYVDDLEDILVRLESVGWAAPQTYRDKLSALISQLKSGSSNSSPTGTASGKRLAGSLDRMSNKRMK